MSIAHLCAAAMLAYCPQVIEVDPFPQKAMINPWLGKIYISRGLVRNKDEYAFVVAHELGHVTLRHNRHTELDADEQAIRILGAAGVSCVGISVLARIDAMRWKIAKEKCNG